MRYQELLDEYRQLLQRDVQLRQQMQAIPKGYIVTKRISGKEYYYLQYSVQGKKKSEYIHHQDLAAIKTAIANREPIRQEIERNRAEQERLEGAVRILDTSLYRLFWCLKQCAEMDAMPITKRPHALSFAKAMTALEGVPAQEETEIGLQLWSIGAKSFADVYLRALHKYGIVEVAQ